MLLGCSKSIQADKVLSDEQYLSITRLHIYFSMPSSLYGHTFNEVILAGNNIRTMAFWRKLWSFFLLQTLQYGVLIILYVCLADKSNECRADNIFIRTLVLGSALVQVVPSSRDIVKKFFTIYVYNYAIIEDSSNAKVLKCLTNGSVIDRTIIWAVNTTILTVEFTMWMTVIGCAVRSILFAKSIYQIIFCRFKIILIHKADSLLYRLLVPETVRASQSKQLFFRGDSFSKEILSLPFLASLQIILVAFLDFLQKSLESLRVFVVVGIFIVLFELYEVCYQQYQWLPRDPFYFEHHVFALGIGDISAAKHTVDRFYNDSCSIPTISYIFNNSYLPYYMWLNRACVPTHGIWEGTITAAYIMGDFDNINLAVVPIAAGQPTLFIIIYLLTLWLSILLVLKFLIYL